ncbi:DUF6848 family protein [Desulfotruncus alcoholivorax]|uniref:DUF6848 family protein n=1 Tax=Desulfotruncus alcoholivorax TaxID=265477 RepID=UPI00040F1750|nr:hypothetical protein [Desulfotruncus alcoholivorax]
MEQVISQEQIEKWKQEHGDVYKIEGDEDSLLPVCIFRKPGRPDLSRFTKESLKDVYKSMNNLVYGCLLYPSADVVRKAAEEKPGIIIAYGGELQKIVGVTQDFLSTKL